MKSLPRTKEGNIIVPIIWGHLVIPVTKKKYEIFSSLDIEVTRKDFEIIEGKWKKVFKHLINNRLNRHELSAIFFHLANVIYQKIKRTQPKIFKEADFINICHVYPIKLHTEKEAVLNVYLDCLREYKHKV